eukprot:224080-Chlamydomonas_euryale.AAC.1
MHRQGTSDHALTLCKRGEAALVAPHEWLEAACKPDTPHAAPACCLSVSVPPHHRTASSPAGADTHTHIRSHSNSHSHMLRREIPNIDAVLLSHGELSHLGALPYLVTKCGLTAPVFSTGPTRRMGEMFLRESVQAKLVRSRAA